jgi:TonB-linked SusC/RagA family outer membrane protein
MKVGYNFGSAAMASFFTRLTYNYDNRYMATYTYRYDGSSNFGPRRRWAGFHAAAASWRFTNEQFFKNWNADVISDGKIRIGWGQTGNSDIPGYRWGSAISRMPTGLGAGYRQYNIANPYIQWETQTQWNFGLDMGFFNERIKLTVELYDKKSSNMLMNMQLPTYMGSSELSNPSSRLEPPMGNYGTIDNKGLEIAVSTRNLENRNGGLEWETDFQISFNRNKLVALDGTENAHIEGYAQWIGTGELVSLSRIGEPLYSFYGYVTDGYYKDLADIQNSPKGGKYPADGKSFNRNNTVWAGDQKFLDISGPDGVPDNVIDEYDRQVIGSPMPKFTFGMTNTFRYRNFDLSIFINGSYGNKIYNRTAAGLSNMNTAWDNQLQYIKDRAQLEVINPNTTYDGANGVWNWYDDIGNVRIINGTAPTAPRAIRGDPNDNDRVSNRYIENGSYLRIKNVTIGYTLPQMLTQKVKLSTVRAYVNIQNLWTLTKYTGYDPEVGVNTMTPNVYGLDYGRYPSPAVFSFGLNLSF